MAAPLALAEPIVPTHPISAIHRLRIGWNVVRPFLRLGIIVPPFRVTEPETASKGARFLERPPVHPRNAFPHLGIDRLGEALQRHVHADRNLAVNLDNLAARNAPMMDGAQLVNDA